MKTNALPPYDMTDNPTGCCPRFNPKGWDGQELHFQDKPFLRATTISLAHIPLNMAPVFRKTFAAIRGAQAEPRDELIVLSRDLTAWSAEHLFSVTKDVPGQQMVRLSGDYLTHVFEGPYSRVPKWERELQERAEASGRRIGKVYFFYTTCPKCARTYAKNYVVGVAEVVQERAHAQ